MEIVVGVEGINESKREDSVPGDQSSSQNSLEQIADPVVYQLVRVQGDGRLVPATDDELMEVEDLLKVDKSEVKGSEKNVGESLNGGPFSEDLLAEGSLQLENVEVDEAQLNAGLEEKLLSSPTVIESQSGQCRSDGGCSKQADGKHDGLPSDSTCNSLKPIFSMLSGEICLDNLSIRELHETFRATFGRETTVKDKQWLKRRIAMGLTNSCDVSTMTFILKNGKLEKEKSDSSMAVDSASPILSEIGRVSDSHKLPLSSHNRELERHQNVSGTKVERPGVDDDCPMDEFQAEQRAAKRARKPTKRYIEEMSEVDSGDADGRLISPAKRPGQNQAYPKSSVASVRNLYSHGRTLVTRLDSLGGSGVRVPYVSRVRRSRPRKDIMSLMLHWRSLLQKCDPSSMETAAHLVKKVLAVSDSQLDNVCGGHLLRAEAGNKYQQSLIAQEKDKQWSGIGRVKQDQNLIADTSDNNGDFVPTAKGGIKRKHHRAWTLAEVMKLVEGVSHYGAGRWSEIKRIAFASDTYRTAVDLKDKWRNLLRASFAQMPQDKGLSSRKHAPAPIPAPILIRVRELAEMHAQAPPVLTSSKTASCGGTNVNEIKLGYL